MARGLRISLSESESLPAWRTAMSVNTRINLGLNTQNDVQPANNASINPEYPGDAPWRGTSLTSGPGYTTANYAPDLGTHGSILYAAGGHGAYYGNELWRFDIGTRLFSCMSDPYTSNSHPGNFFEDAQLQHSDNINGELYMEASPLTSDPTQPTAFQGYSTNVVIPASAGVTGVGASGAFVTPMRSARTRNGNVTDGNPTTRAHIFDLAQTNRATATWARFSTNVGREVYLDLPAHTIFNIGWAVFDPTRKKIFLAAALSGGHDRLRVLNCSGATAFWDTAITLSTAVWQHQHGNAFHWAANPDYLILFHWEAASPTFNLINVDTGVVSSPGWTGTAPQLTGGSDWVESAQKLVMYEGADTTDNIADLISPSPVGDPNKVWILTPPSSSSPSVFTTTPWTWSSQTITGPTPPSTINFIPHAGRFNWCESVQCFLWWANGDDNVQAWVVNGFGD
jgi:hypothetical protein